MDNGRLKRVANHNFDEWRDFCKWVESLPYSELIMGGVVEDEMSVQNNDHSRKITEQNGYSEGLRRMFEKRMSLFWEERKTLL